MPFVRDDPTVRVLTGGCTFKLLDRVAYNGAEDSWQVPAGFRTDFASIPSIVAWLVPKLGIYTLAAIVHDYFCALGIALGLITSRNADKVFRRMIREAGDETGTDDPVLRWLIWTGVRWGALVNPVRRPGWHRDAPLVLLITLLALPFVLPPVLFAGLALLIKALVNLVVGRPLARVFRYLRRRKEPRP